MWWTSKAINATTESSADKIRHRVIKSSSMSSASVPDGSIGYRTGGVMVAADAPARRFNEAGSVWVGRMDVYNRLTELRVSAGSQFKLTCDV